MISFVVGVGLCTVAAGALVARYVEIPGHLTLYAVIASPFLVMAAVLALLVFVWGRRWAMAAIACCLTAALMAPQIPWYVSADPGQGGVPLRAMTINMLFGNADAKDVVERATSAADVVMAQELTPEAVRALSAAGMNAAFPFQALEPRAEAAGVGVYSRFPITDVLRIPGYELAMVKARVHVAGVSDALTVMSIHFAAPWPQPIDGWRRDVSKFGKTLAEVADQSNGAPVLVGGDFNSTIDMRPYRELLSNGYRDAAEQAGAGREFTYPSNERIPPFMGIDHFLTRDCTAVSSYTARIAGTDHRALLATVMLPAAGTS